MRRLLLFNISVLLVLQGFGQSLQGIVTSAEDGKPLKEVKVTHEPSNQWVKTDSAGNFTLTYVSLPATLTIRANGFIAQTLEIMTFDRLNVQLIPKQRVMNTVVVSAGRRDQQIEEIPISIEIIKPALVANKGLTNLAQAVDQSPGVYVMDGQVSIRGGGGFAYGAGSRVLLLWNGVPMLSPDIGDAKWNAVPMEQASQIEILKGASSVLYGSGALNGIIALNEREPGSDGVLEAKIQSGVYDNPNRKSLQWWGKGKEQAFNPTFHMADLYYGKSIKNIGYTIGANVFFNEAFRQGEQEKRARINGSFYYRPLKENTKLKAGISYNLQLQDAGVFVLWKNDSMCYQAMDNTISRQKAVRFNVDPYLKFIDRKNNKHHFRTRYYLVTTGNDTKVYDASFAQMYYFDYQFQKKDK